MNNQNIIFTEEQYDRFYGERFIYNDEFYTISKLMENEEYHILITGLPGCGK